jgi:hypothetical protein
MPTPRPTRISSGEPGDDEGQGRGQQRTEHQHQDDQRGQQPGPLGGAAGRLLGAAHRVPAELDPEPVTGGGPGRVDDPAHVRGRHVLGLRVQGDGGVSDGAVGGGRALGREGAAHVGDVRRRGDPGQHRLDPVPLRGQPARGVEHHLDAGPGLRRRLRPQCLQGPLRLGPGQGEIVVVLRAGRPRPEGHRPEDEHPCHQRPPAPPIRPACNSLEHGPNGTEGVRRAGTSHGVRRS